MLDIDKGDSSDMMKVKNRKPIIKLCKSLDKNESVEG